ncbi:Uma2 family endonuclease [Streptomyces zhihengii]|uniref:Uma2 family endonuclease n=1 Tax=Streptomyces zhihengii TaxID=1818004 RepID=UPI0033A34749
MTRISAEHPQMSVEEFEEIERHTPDTVRLEFINGKLEVKPVPDGDHGEIYMWLLEQCMRHRPDLRLYPDRGLVVEGYRRGRARPDGVLAPARHFAGHGEWSSPQGVVMVAEITSHDADTDRRDRVEKRDGYAQAEIPVYLLVDRDADSLLVHSRPEDGVYHLVEVHSYGKPAPLPAPVGITLDTEPLKDLSA